MFKEIFLTCLYLLLFNFIIYRNKNFQLKSFKPFVSNFLFNLKFLVGIFIWFIYTFYYKDTQNNDVHKFYNDALILNSAAYENPGAFSFLITGIGSEEAAQPYTAQMKNWERNFDQAPFNENKTVIRLNALLMFLSFKTYFVHILMMCFISLLGWILLSNAIVDYSQLRNPILILIVLIIPSVLFWTSGVMKEPILVFGLGLFVSGLVNFRTALKARPLIFLASGTIILLLIKFYVLVCLFPAALAFLLFPKKQSINFVGLKYSVIYFVLLIAAFNIHCVIPGINLQQMIVNKQEHAIKEAAYFNAGSRIEMSYLNPTATDILDYTPVGIWNTILRPYPWEAKNLMMLCSAAENVLVILLIIYCLFLTNFRDFRQVNLVIMLLCFSLTYFALIGICTPVLGNLVRYKAPVLPLFLFAFIINTKQLKPLRTLSFLQY
jgi:hypothetical protein